jgi:hypothetical protein
MLAWISETTLTTITGATIAALIYLAIALSRLAQKVANLEGRLRGVERAGGVDATRDRR